MSFADPTPSSEFTPGVFDHHNTFAPTGGAQFCKSRTNLRKDINVGPSSLDTNASSCEAHGRVNEVLVRRELCPTKASLGAPSAKLKTTDRISWGSLSWGEGGPTPTQRFFKKKNS